MPAPQANNPRPHGPSPDSAADVVVRTENVHKSFGDDEALRGVSVTVRAGELFGFIGPDGAGKTTLFRILTSLMTPDRGTARVLGLDVVDQYRLLRPRLGYMAGEFSLYPDLSVEENLRFFASVFGTTPDEQMDVIRPVYRQLEPFADRRAEALSGGMKQKLALCCALVHRPELLVLDEPTTGVDAVSRRDFWDLLANLRDDGLPILVSTPYMDEASRCDRVALMQTGQILAVDSPDAIRQDYPWPLVAVRTDRRYAVLKRLRELDHAHSVFPFGATLHYADERTDASREVVAEEVRAFLERHDLPADVRPIRPDIEDVFMARASTP